jgi:hypothetical protein
VADARRRRIGALAVTQTRRTQLVGPQPFVAEPNVFGESSDTARREHNHSEGAQGGNWFPP